MFIGGILLDLGSVVGAALVEDAVPLLCTEDDAVDGRERGDLRLWRGVGPLSVRDGRLTHRAPLPGAPAAGGSSSAQCLGRCSIYSRFGHALPTEESRASRPGAAIPRSTPIRARPR